MEADGMQDTLDALVTTLRVTLRTELTSVWLPIQFGVIAVAALASWGCAAAIRRKFDLVSTDVMMPRMDGYELTRALRAMPAYAATPIVMVTSMGERIDRVRGFDAGVDEYMTKPLDSGELVRVVERHIGRRHS